MPTEKVTFPPYLVPYVCFRCRKSFKRQDREGTVTLTCPNCGGSAHRTSRNFKAPSQGDQEQWEKIAFLLRHGFRFSTLRTEDGERIPYPATLEEAHDFVRKYSNRAGTPINEEEQ